MKSLFEKKLWFYVGGGRGVKRLNLLSNKLIKVKFPDREEKSNLTFRTAARNVSSLTNALTNG